MKYRVGFSFWAPRKLYYTEWFDTMDKAITFTMKANGVIHILVIEDETGEIV